jgi:hypothetical protein
VVAEEEAATAVEEASNDFRVREDQLQLILPMQRD